MTTKAKTGAGLLVHVPGASDLLGITYPAVLELIATGELPSASIGGRTWIPAKSCHEYVARITEGAI